MSKKRQLSTRLNPEAAVPLSAGTRHRAGAWRARLRGRFEGRNGDAGERPADPSASERRLSSRTVRPRQARLGRRAVVTGGGRKPPVRSWKRRGWKRTRRLEQAPPTARAAPVPQRLPERPGAGQDVRARPKHASMGTGQASAALDQTSPGLAPMKRAGSTPPAVRAAARSTSGRPTPSSVSLKVPQW